MLTPYNTKYYELDNCNVVIDIHSSCAYPHPDIEPKYIKCHIDISIDAYFEIKGLYIGRSYKTNDLMSYEDLNDLIAFLNGTIDECYSTISGEENSISDKNEMCFNTTDNNHYIRFIVRPVLEAEDYSASPNGIYLELNSCDSYGSDQIGVFFDYNSANKLINQFNEAYKHVRDTNNPIDTLPEFRQLDLSAKGII